MKSPRHEDISVFEKLDQNKNDENSNKYIVVLNLPERIQDALTNKPTSLDGVPFRVISEGFTALLKIYSSHYTYAVRGPNHG